jgi:hypothetical protein
MIKTENFYNCKKDEMGTTHAIEVPIYIADASAENGYRREITKVEATIISYRTSKVPADAGVEAVFLPVFAYLSPESGTIHVIEPYDNAIGMVRVNRVTLSNNAIKRLAKVAGFAVTPLA